MTMKLAIINGPNLNLLGQREPEIYGHRTFDAFLDELRGRFRNVQFEYFQSNVEGALIDALQRLAGAGVTGIVLNAGAYTHTSLALADAVAACRVPVVEVHISNIFAREDRRHVSLLGAKAVGVIAGFGLESYGLAIEFFQRHSK
jgi:3-dehydroquinate dehydratase-2